MNKRIGNDLTFTWKISRKNESSVVPENFNGKDVEVTLLTPSKKQAKLDDITINTGVVSFVFKGKNQIELGQYIAILSENKGDDGMVTIDTINAVTLVPHSYMEQPGEESTIEVQSVNLESLIIVTTQGGGGIDQQQADWAQTDNTAVDYIKNKPTLAPVATSGSYNDLINKPTIPAAQVQSDWNESDTTSKAYILNKPTIPTVPTNVSAFTNDAGYLTQHQDITGKADKVSNATNGNFAALDSNGNLTDSGHKHSDYLTQHQDLSNYVQKSQTAGLLKNDGTVDTNTYLTQHQDINGKADKSEMSVVPGTGANADKTTITLKQGTSATVLIAHQDITGKENVMPITTATGATLSAVVGNYYRLDNVGTLAITLPTIVGATKLQAITFLLVCGSSALVTFAPQGSETILYQEDFALEADTTYEVTALWNGSEWTLSRVIYE